MPTHRPLLRTSLSFMTSVPLLQICFLSACSNALLIRNDHPLNVNKAAVAARRSAKTSSAGASTANNNPSRRHRARRCNSGAHSSPYRRRTSSIVYRPAFLQKTSRAFTQTKPVPRRKQNHNNPNNGHSRRQSGEIADLDQILAIHSSLEEAMLRPEPSMEATPLPSTDNGGPADALLALSRSASSADELSETRSARSASTASRTTNRLSLTLPIAPPTANPSRPTPTSSTLSSYPPTPVDTPALMSPTDPNDFITAVAAQERRVLELREELSRAESELTKLKKKWASHEAQKKRAEIRNAEPLRQLNSSHTEAQEDSATRRSLDLDRRKAILLGQQSQQSTPTQSRRRVFRGGHARTLSLLSPAKGSDGFSVHEDAPETVKSPLKDFDSPYVNRYAPIVPAQLPKRASWAPRSAHQNSGVKQIAEDFRAGLWTFMEDLRQATVGEEPITGQSSYLRGIDANSRSSTAQKTDTWDGDQDTIRAPCATPRPLASSVFDDTPTPASRFVDVQKQEKDTTTEARHKRTVSKTTSKTGKHFSWTPLTINSYDDNDWSNWDSPTVKSPRWSGTTVNGDIIPAIPEKEGESQTSPYASGPPSSRARNQPQAPARTPPLTNALRRDQKSSPPRNRRPSSYSPPSPNKLEELLPPVLNRLTPSNLKRTATDFMKEWEKSLSPPPESANFSLPERTRVEPAGTDL